MNRTALWIGAGVIGFVWLAGKSNKPTPNPTPEPLPEETALDETDALARVVTSEANRYSEPERNAIAWAVRNRARKRRTTIARMVCSPSCGRCCHGRPFSSARRATPENRALAARVLAAPQSADPTNGATSFFEPGVQDLLVALGRDGYRFTSQQLRQRWTTDGQQPLDTVGAFEFWGRRRSTT